MKSAPSAASHSGQQKEKESVTNAEAGMQVRDPMDMSNGGSTTSTTAMPAHHRRRISVKSEPVAVTTQEGVDGSREKAMRIGSVEQFELRNIMELSIMGHVLNRARQMNFSGGLSLCKAVGWNAKNHRHLRVARRLRLETHPSLLVVPIKNKSKKEVWWSLC